MNAAFLLILQNIYLVVIFNNYFSFDNTLFNTLHWEMEEKNWIRTVFDRDAIMIFELI